MLNKESPFSSMINNTNNNNFFNNQNHYSNDKNDKFDIFSDKNINSHISHTKTKERISFYNKDSPSQIKECLNYFLNGPKNGNINVLYITDKNFPFGITENVFKDGKSVNNYDNINPNLEKNRINENNFENIDSQDNNLNIEDTSYAAPPCKKSNNSCFSGSTLSSSSNSYFDRKEEKKIDYLTDDFGKIELNEKSNFQTLNINGNEINNPKILKKYAKFKKY